MPNEYNMSTEEMEDPRSALLNGDLQAQASAIAELVRTGGESSITRDDPSPPANFRNEKAPVDRGTPTRPSGAKPAGGRGDLVRFLEDSPPFEGAADVFKETQRTASKQAEEINGLKTMVARMEGLLTGKGIIEKEPAEVVDPQVQARRDLLGRANPQTRQLLEAFMAENGYVREADMAAKEQEQRLNDMASQDLRKAAEQYGEDFGSLNEKGEFEGWNPDTAPMVNAVLERLVDPERGATPHDLYQLARFDDLVEQAYQKGVEEAKIGRARVNKAASFPVANGTTPSVANAPAMYIKGEDPDTTKDRALVASIKKMQAAGYRI